MGRRLQARRLRQRQFVEQEGGGSAAVGGREQPAGLAGGAEALGAELNAEGGAQRAEGGRQRAEGGLDAALELAVAEGCGGGEGAEVEVLLVVPVDRSTQPEAHVVDHRAVEADLPLRGEARLDHVDAHAVGGRACAGNAVERAELGDGGADVALVKEIGRAEGAAEGAGEGIVLPAVGRCVVAGVAAEDVGGKGPLAGRTAHPRRPIDAPVHRGQAAGRHAADAGWAEPRRNALVGDVDDAADRLRAEAQGGGAADHLDALGGERIDRDGVVLREIGDILRADAVFLDAHAGVVEAADDRPAGAARRETGAGDAGQGVELVAERCAAVAADLGLGNNGDGHEGAVDDLQLAVGEAEIAGRAVGVARGLDEDLGQGGLGGGGGDEQRQDEEACRRSGEAGRGHEVTGLCNVTTLHKPDEGRLCQGRPDT